MTTFCVACDRYRASEGRLMLAESNVTYPSLDGLMLAGTMVEPTLIPPELPPILMVHGITADRDEGGFFRDIAAALAERGVPSLRFDLRADGESAGMMEALTLCSCVSDISASASWLKRRLVGTVGPPAGIGARFGGGLALLYAARRLVTDTSSRAAGPDRDVDTERFDYGEAQQRGQQRRETRHYLLVVRNGHPNVNLLPWSTMLSSPTKRSG